MSRARSDPRVEIALLFCWNFAAVTAFFVGRAVRDALFLAHESPAQLPYMYIASPIAVTLVGLAYGRIAPRFPRERVVVATPLVFAALVVAARLVLGPSWLYYALYVGVECLGALAMMQFWLTAGERFSPRDAKRWFGVIAAGGTAANIVIGFVLRAAVGHTGAEDLLWLVVGALVAVAGLAWSVGRRPHPREAGRSAPKSGAKASTPRAHGKDEPVAGTSHLRLLAPLIACTMLAVTLLDFQFKAITTEHYDADRVAMVEFFGTLSIVTGTASLIVQLALTGKILGRFGVAGALLLLPSTMALGAAALLVVPSLIAATVSKFGDQTLRYTVHDAGMQIVYMPVPRAVRAKKKAFLDTVVRPASEATVGAFLLGYRALSGALWPLAIAALVVSLVWIALVVRLRGAYAGAVAETLRRRRVMPVELDEEHATREAASAVRGVLRAGERAEIVRALELAKASRLVAAGALASAEIAPFVTHDDAGVRAAALVALGPAAGEASARALADPVLEVRAAAAVALHQIGDAAQRAMAIEHVTSSVTSDEPSVRRAGLAAVAELGDPAWTEPVVALLGARRWRRPTLEALAAIGAPAERAVLAALDGDDAAARSGALHALAVIGSPSAVARLVACATTERTPLDDEVLRDAACAALWAAARRGAQLETSQVREVVAAARRELEVVFTAMAAADGLGRRESTLVPDGTRRAVPFLLDSAEGAAALISRALRERSERATARALDLIGAADPTLSLDVARDNLREPEPTRRANAVELLEAQRWSSPVAPLRALVLAAIDESPRDRKLAIAERGLELPRHTRDGWLLSLLADADPWIVCCAAYLAGASGVVAARERLDALTRDERALVAETARTALARLDPTSSAEARMLTTADKVLFLKGLELFAQVPGADLAEVVAATEEVELDDDERLFGEGEPGDALYLIVDGRVAVLRGSTTLAELGVREVLGEMALLDPAPRSATAIARGAVRLLRLGRDDFVNLLSERPEVAAGVIRVLTRRLRAAGDKAAEGAPGR